MTLLDVARDLRIASEWAEQGCDAMALYHAERAVRRLQKSRPGLRLVRGPEHISAVLGRALEQIKPKGE